jgi:hypothetical protein
MKYTYGTIIAVAAALFFYLRLIILQRQKVKQLSRVGKTDRKKNRSSSNDAKKGNGLTTAFPKLDITSPYLLGLGILLIISGAVLSAAPWLNLQGRDLWWIPVTLGIILMTITIR